MLAFRTAKRSVKVIKCKYLINISLDSSHFNLNLLSNNFMYHVEVKFIKQLCYVLAIVPKNMKPLGMMVLKITL